MKQTKIILISSLLLSLIHSTSYANASNNNEANYYNQRILSVSGNGKESIPTSIANVILAIEINSGTANLAQKEVAKRANIVVDYLRSQNVSKLKTTSVNLNPRYEYENNKPPKLVGYTANNGISFQIPQDKAGIIIDEAIRLGTTRIDGISFSADNEAIQKAKNLAIAKAVKDAEQKAKFTLSTLSFSIKDIISIKVDNAEPISINQPRVMMERSMMAKTSYADSASPVIGGDEEVDANITLNIAY
ncbi:MAG: hypothetical protein RLZZ210_701 [Pseudomonadota bacterium]|jgi:uncharacterized protein YggE